MDQDIKRSLTQILKQAAEMLRALGETHLYTAHLMALLLILYQSVKTEATADPSKSNHLELQTQALQDTPLQQLLNRCNEPGNGARIDQTLRDIANSSPELAGVLETIQFDHGQLEEKRRRDEKISELLNLLASYQLEDKVSFADQLDAFLIDVAMVKGRTNGEFCTPPAVAELVASLMSPQDGEEIYDPACGTGSLLIQCAKQVKQPDTTNDVSLYGQEINANTWAIAQMNLTLHGEKKYDLKQGDTLRTPKFLQSTSALKSFDVVVSNPPYNVSDWGYDSALHDPFVRFQFGIPPRTRADSAFILHMVASMKHGSGRCAAIIPHGILFRQGTEKEIRRQLLASNLIDAVIGLPPKLLFNTPIPTALLILRREKTDRDVLFVDASSAFQPGKIFNTLRGEDIQRIVEACVQRKSIDGFAKLVTESEINAKDCGLNLSLYIGKPHQEKQVNLQANREEHAVLRHELLELENQLAALRLEIDHE